MAGRGMGAATRGGGAVEGGAKNKKPKGMMAGGMASSDPMRNQMMAPGMKKGGDVKKKPKGMMAGGMATKGMAAGGMMSKGYAAGGPVKMTKGMAAGGKR